MPEFEILDTDAFDDDRYWDVFVEVSLIFIFLTSDSANTFTVCERRGPTRQPLYPDHFVQSWPRPGNFARNSSALVPEHMVMAPGKTPDACYEWVGSRQR